ncbi:unnamed protein product [Acanthoscelides obtectus]|uniref:Uncharacterized protein n=1 Tax=Acanthoscelides obtectus TaxID=200917 RepID=A0A9P0KWH7_ACAOB|nr:unnamed protein product [Acanthoscelides obtectus]CAK1628606.1 hypothetical protein AOBTE_LOCUS5302 [Acanthoscelides obtectus]
MLVHKCTLDETLGRNGRLLCQWNSYRAIHVTIQYYEHTIRSGEVTFHSFLEYALWPDSLMDFHTQYKG